MQLLSRYETELTAIAKYLLQEIPEKNMYWNISDFEEDLPEDIEKNMNTYFSEIGRGTHIIIVREDEIHFLISHANIGKDEETKNLLQFSQRLIYVRGDVTNEQFVDNREEYVSKRDHITVILLGTVHLKGNWFFGSYIAN